MRLSELTRRQIQKLCESTGKTESGVVETAVDRMAREELKSSAVTSHCSGGGTKE